MPKQTFRLPHIYKFNFDTGFTEPYYSNSNLYYQYKLVSTSNPIIYDLGFSRYSSDTRIVDFTSINGLYDDTVGVDIEAQIPLFFKQRNTIKVPNKVEYAIRKHLTSYLHQIHPEKEVAKELCLLMLAQLNSTHFDIKAGRDTSGWKRLKAEYLQNLISNEPTAYKNIIEVLQTPLRKGQILEVDPDYAMGSYSRKYRLGEPYRAKGISLYELRTKTAINAFKRYQLGLLDTASDNPICQNLIRFYPSVKLPTIDQLKAEAKRLIKLDYTTKKGKTLKFLNKHSREYFANPEQYSFVEDAIEIFEYLTDNGLMVPCVGGEESGGRVVDSFTLMPSWIRRLVKVDDKIHVEADYSCLHPNIAIAEYGGRLEYLTHGDVALELNTNVSVVKTEHLSFFNRTTQQMKESPLWPYYQKHEPDMLQKIVREKLQSQFKYKATSRMLFKKEVGIMTEVIKQLNAKNIYVGYVYDALFCSPKQTELVNRTMNEVIERLGVKTEAKVSTGKKYNPLVEELKERRYGDMRTKYLNPILVENFSEYIHA